jgi:hypothetical protein
LCPQIDLHDPDQVSFIPSAILTGVLFDQFCQALGTCPEFTANSADETISEAVFLEF